MDAGEDRVDIPEERVDNPEDRIDIPEEVEHDEDIIGEENHGERFVEEGDDYIELENGFVENVEDIQFELEHPAEETEFIKKESSQKKNIGRKREGTNQFNEQKAEQNTCKPP